MSLFGDFLGYINAGKAGTGLQNAYNTAASNVGTATSGAINRIDRTLQDNAANVNNAAGTAIGTVGGAADTANANVAKLYREVTGNLSPYLEGGAAGVKGLTDYAASSPTFKFNLDDYFNSPAYNFEVEKGNKAIGNAASAQGLLASGAAMKSMDDYTQSTAAKYYDQAYNEALSGWQTNQKATLDNLTALINSGLTASGQYSQAAQNTNALQSGNTMNAGLFAGSTLDDVAKFLASQNLQGNVIAGQAGMTGAKDVSNYGIDAANARAGQILNQGKIMTAGAEDLSTLIQNLLAMKGGG